MFEELETQRLLLRQLHSSDDDIMFQLRSNDEVNKFLDRKKAETIEDARAHINRLLEGPENGQLYYWILERKEDQQSIGTICLWNIDEKNNTAEIGYEMLPQFQGNGLMNEAISKIIEFGTNSLELSAITAWMHKDNLASIHLLEKRGFTRDLAEENKQASLNELGEVVIYKSEINKI